MTLIKGVDISVIQGNVDFVALAASGVQFVICRCGVGNGGKDKLYDTNIEKAKAAGLKVMAYNFIYPLPTIPSQPLRDAKAQAKLHVDWTKGELCAVDLEWPAPQDWAKWGCTAPQIVQWTIDYLEEYERLSGIRPLVYTYPNFADNIHLPESFGEKYKLWIASYTAVPRIPKPWTDWVLWQDSGGTQKLPNGVPVDTDKAKDLSVWDTAPAAPPDPVTPPDPAPLPDPIPVDPEPTPATTDVASTIVFSNIGNLISSLFKKS
jgi:lysozyme